MGVTTIRLANDRDLLEQDPRVEQFYPRKDSAGNVIRDWDREHRLATTEIERRFRAKMVVRHGEFEIGRLGLRSREKLRECAACYALYFIYRTCNTQGDYASFFSREEERWLRRAGELFEAEEGNVDYDEDGDDVVSPPEQSRPMPSMLRRG